MVSEVLKTIFAQWHQLLSRGAGEPIIFVFRNDRIYIPRLILWAVLLFSIIYFSDTMITMIQSKSKQIRRQTEINIHSFKIIFFILNS